MSLNIDINKNCSCESFWCFSKSVQWIFDFAAELQRSESWEYVPLESSRLSIVTILISVVFYGSDSCNPVLPSFVGFGMLKNLSEAQHRIQEDIDFGALKIDDYLIIN